MSMLSGVKYACRACLEEHVGLVVAFPLPPGLPRFALAGFASHDSTRACFPVLLLSRPALIFLLKKQR